MKTILACGLILGAIVLYQVVVRILLRKKATGWRGKGLASLAAASIMAVLAMLLMLIDGGLAAFGLLQMAKYGLLVFLIGTFGSILLWFLVSPRL